MAVVGSELEGLVRKLDLKEQKAHWIRRSRSPRGEGLESELDPQIPGAQESNAHLIKSLC